MTNAATRTHAQRSIDAEERLTQALAELIAEQGFERTTAAEIGERAGYSRAVVRDRYGSKEALLLAFHERYERMLVGDRTDAANHTGLALVAAALDRLVVFARDHPVWLRALFAVSFESAGAATPFAPVVADWVQKLEANATAWLERGQADGSVDAALDAATEARRAVDEGMASALRWTLGRTDADYLAGLEQWKQDSLERFRARTERPG